MKTIKFRAFNKETKEMIDLHKITPLALNTGMNDQLAMQNRHGLFIPFFKELELMQFTGLKDKNGKEAYAEYIVKYIDDSGTPQVGVIVDMGWKFYIEAVGGDDEGNQDLELHPDNEFEIIGNKFENSELLKT